MVVLDALSRSQLNHSELEFTENSLIDYIHFVPLNIPISDTRLKQFEARAKLAVDPFRLYGHY